MGALLIFELDNVMETIFFKRNYIFRVWASTIISAPILMMFLTAILMAKQGNKLDLGAFGFIAFSIGYGFLFSIPAFLIMYFLFFPLSKRFRKAFHLKLISTLIGITCIGFTFYLLYGGDAYNLNGNYAALTFSVAYTFCFTIFGFLFPIKTLGRRI